MTPLLWLALIPGLAAVAAAMSAYGSRRWVERVRALTRRLDAARSHETRGSQRAGRFDLRELEGLPPPVQRYFRAALTEGQPVIAAVTFEMAGTFNLSTTADQWKPFRSWQHVVTRRPGFLWNGGISLWPGLTVRVVDSYVAGEGLLHAALLGLFTVAKVAGGGEIARGEFLRFFAEAPWYPTALLPSQGVQWTAVDAHSATASIADGALNLTLLFRFNDAGLIDSVRAEARSSMEGHTIVMMPWECSMSNFQVRDGMTVPMTGEAAWIRPAGRKPYFKGTIKSLSYEFAL